MYHPLNKDYIYNLCLPMSLEYPPLWGTTGLLKTVRLSRIQSVLSLCKYRSQPTPEQYEERAVYPGAVYNSANEFTTIPNQGSTVILRDTPYSIQGSSIFISRFCVLRPMLGTDGTFMSVENIYRVGYLYPTSTAIIVINRPINDALIKNVHLWTLKSIDNVSYFLRGPTKYCLKYEMVTEHQLSIPI